MPRFETLIASRYLGTQKKGAFIRLMARMSTVGMALGVFAMLVCTALMNGASDEIQTNLFRATSHFAVGSTVGGTLLDTEAVLKKVRALPGVVAASPVRQEYALAKSRYSDAMGFLTLFAVDPASAGPTTTMLDSLKPIAIKDLQEGEIVMGQEAAERIHARVGDTLALTFGRMEVGLGGTMPRTKAVRLAGTFKCGISTYDQGWAYMHLEDAKALADTTEAEMVAVRTRTLQDIDRVKAEAEKVLDPKHYVLLDLRSQNQPLFAALKVQKWAFTTILSLLVIVAAFNMVACLVTLVAEKRRDLGVLLSLGATPEQVQRIFTGLAMRLALRGVLWGLGLGIPACFLANHFKLVRLPAAAYDFITYLPFHMQILDILLLTAFPFGIAWLAARFPARKAATTDPVDALRAD